MDAQDLYLSLGQLISQIPAELSVQSAGPVPNSVRQWMGRASALVLEAGQATDSVKLALLSKNLGTYAPSLVVGEITSILYTALGHAEMRAPAAARGAFINAGNALDAMSAVSAVVGAAASGIRIIDPYMDAKALTSYAVLSPDTVSIQLLADTASVKASLAPAVSAFRTQYPNRTLEYRLAPAHSLHDRLIIVDGSVAWTLTQSLNNFAARAPASILKVDPETAALKIAAYQAFWLSATVVP